MDVAEIYTFLGQAIAGSILEDEWQRAYMLIERQEGMVAFGVGKYTDDSAYLKPFNVRDRQASMQAARLLNQLHAITTAGGHNRWNFLWFTLLPSGAYEIEFIWNQDAEDKLRHIGETRELGEPARFNDLQVFKRAQAERGASQVYARLVQAVVQLIPEEWTSAQVSLREAGIGIIEHHASYQPADDGLYITQSWAALRAVEELRYMKTAGGHPDWQQVSFEIAAAGTYRATFTTEPVAKDAPAGSYAYDGHWLPATTE